MTITIESRGRRHYLIGNTYPIKDTIRSAGCKWDPEAKAWYSGKRDTVEGLVGRVQSGGVKATASYVKLPDGSWGVRISGEAKPGPVDVATKSGDRKTETITEVLRTEGDYSFCAIKPREKKQRAPRQPSSVGERGAYTSQFQGSKSCRDPQHKVGESCWLKHGKDRIAVVVVGYERAQWCPGDMLEDNGNYNHGGRGAWLGSVYYRAATRAEYEALQASSPREDGVCVDCGADEVTP